jgi:hypothetical protein
MAPGEDSVFSSRQNSYRLGQEIHALASSGVKKSFFSFKPAIMAHRPSAMT